MKFTLPVVCLALSIPATVVAATSSGRLHGGGGTGSVQAEKATAAEAAVAKSVVRSPKIKSGAHAAGRGLRSVGASTKEAAFFQDVVSSKAHQVKQQQGRALAGTCDMDQTLTKLYPSGLAEKVTTDWTHVGEDVASDGDWMVVGFGEKLNSSSPYQAVYVYKWDGTQWAQHQTIEYPGNGSPVSANYGYRVAISGDTIAVAAGNDVGDGTNGQGGGGGVGAVFIYRLDPADDNWKEEERLFGSAGSKVGSNPAIRLDGDTLVVPDYYEDGSKGAFTIYDRDCSSAPGTCSWSQTEKFTGEASRDNLGYGLAIHGNSLFVGAPMVERNGVGQIDYYTRTQAGGQWTKQQSIVPADAVAGDEFGWVVAFDGNTLAAASIFKNSGHVYIYEQNPTSGQWEEKQTLQPSAGSNGSEYGAWKMAVRGDTLVIPSSTGVDIWKKADGTWTSEKFVARGALGGWGACQSVAINDDAIAIGCWQGDENKGAIYYLTCPDAFTAAVADGGDASATASASAGVATGPTQVGEWWDPTAWDVAPHLTATCAAGFVDCCNGFVCDADGVTQTSTTCQEACGGACCVNDAGTGIADVCLRFTGKVCKDGSCTGEKACIDANISEIINGCQGWGACHAVAYNNGGTPVPRVHNSCRSVKEACQGMASDGGKVGSVINSCNANPDPKATDHTTVDWQGNLVYERQCYKLGWKGTVGDIVDSCAGDQTICINMGSGANARVGNVIRSCTSPAAGTSNPDTRKGNQDSSGCYTLGVNGRVGDIVDSCHDDANYNTGFSACGAIATGGTVGNIVRSCLLGQTCSMMAYSGTVGDVYDSCTVKDSCRSIAWNMFNLARSEVGNIIGSCKGSYSCPELGVSGAFGDILGSCLEDNSCFQLAHGVEDPANASTDKTLICCATESAVTDGTCAAASSDTTLCSIGDATELSAYCGSGSCPVGAPRPPPGPAPAPGPGPSPSDSGGVVTPVNGYHSLSTGGCANRNELGSTFDGSIQDCADACDAEPTCVSFEYSKTGTECMRSTTCNSLDMTLNDPADPFYFYLKLPKLDGYASALSTGGCANRNELGSTFDGSMQDCADACDAEPTCVSFEYSKTGTECMRSTTCNSLDMTLNDPADPFYFYLKLPRPAYPSWFPPSTDGGDSSGIFLNEEKSFDGSSADGTGRYRINWLGFSGNEARTACTWYKLAEATWDQNFNLFETGSIGNYGRLAHGMYMHFYGPRGFSFTTHTWYDSYYTPFDEHSLDTEWHHACVTWDGSSMKAYYDGQRLGDYSSGFSTLNTGNTFSWWGAEDNRFNFKGDQKDLVFIKGTALDQDQIQTVYGLTGEKRSGPAPTDKCLVDQNGCSQVCNSPDGTCSCNEGYSLASDGKNCVDIDECSTDADNCDANASCENTVGGFTCTCNPGYTGSGTSCTDINECTDGSHSCDANASCQNSPAGSHSCTCNAGYVGDGNTCANINECATGNGGCAHICTDTDGSFECSCRAGYALGDDNAGCSTIYVGDDQTLPDAEKAATEAADTVTAFFTARSAHEVASHNLDVATTELKDATTAHAEAQAKTFALTKEYEQAVAYEATMKKAFDDATAKADASDTTAAERYRLPIEAEIAYNEATAVMLEAQKAKEAAESEETTAAEVLAKATTAKDQATTAKATAKTALDAELTNVNANLLIPKINPTTLDFPYVDTDGDLIPNDFDACPTQMGLRRNTNDRTSSDNPGPQDFCPSGCPETGADGTTVLDSDGDTIPDCEDRCPFEAGIRYNHLWTWDKFNANEIDTLDANMAYHGCPDRDNDGIPDKFDACPTQAGGKCYSGCPDKGIDPVTQKVYDGDMDGVSDCDDRCPGFYGPGNSGGCPDGDFDGTPDYRDYCPSNPGTALFSYERKLEGNAQKYMNILGCPDEDGDLVTDQADICDAPAYPNQDADTSTGLTRVAIVNNKGCPLDSDQDGVYDGIDNCDGTVHSNNPVHDPRAIVFSPTDDGFSAANDQTKLGCPKDTDNDGVADGIDQCPTEGGYIGRDGCPVDSDNDGVKDCVSTQAPTSYTWPFQPTKCHSTSAKPDASCCTVEQDMCADTVRGATVYSKEYTHPKLENPVLPGCPFDTDKDGVVDGVDLCPYTTDVEIALAASDSDKVSIDDKGCATMSAAMWESTFVDVTTGSEGANPKVELLFTVDALLPRIATSRKYDVANELVAVQVMDASCTNTFDDETDAGDKLLPATITVNNPGLFTGQTPTGSIPITIDLNLNPDNVVGSEVWTTEPPFDVGSIDFCLGFAVLSDTKKSVTYKELKTTILIDMTQDFAVTDISVERNEAEETTKLIDIEYPLAACQCTTDNTCVDDSALDDSFLSQSDSLKLCVRFAPDTDNNDELPPDYVQMTDVKSFTCNQGGLSISPIVNFERQGDGGQLTAVETINKELGSGESYTEDDRMLVVNTRLPANFFGAEERPVDCVGTIVYEFAAGSVIDPSLVGTDRQRLLSEASVPLTSGQTSRRDAEEAPEAEAESEFSVEVMLAKAAAGRSVGVIAGAAVASALVVASGAAVTTMAIRRGGSSGVPKMSNRQPSTQQSWTDTSASTQEEGRAFTIANGAVA